MKGANPQTKEVIYFPRQVTPRLVTSPAATLRQVVTTAARPARTKPAATVNNHKNGIKKRETVAGFAFFS